MLVEYQHFASLSERNILPNWFGALQCEKIQYFVKRSKEREFVGKFNTRIPRTLILNVQ